MIHKTSKIMRNILGILLLLLAINAFGGGYYGMTGAKAIPTEWLKNSPFNNYLIPGLILFVCVGGTALLASILVFRHDAHANKAAAICGIIVIGWLIAQVAIIGFVSWLQPAIAIVATIILLLTWKLRKYEH